jgi:hypothetical protein
MGQARRGRHFPSPLTIFIFLKQILPMKKFIFLLLFSLLCKAVFSQNSNGVHRSGKKPPPSYLEGYTGAIGCAVPMSSQLFEKFKSTVSEGLSDEDKILAANQSILSYCLLCWQIREIIDMLGFEESKLHFAKIAYRHAYDIDNYNTLTEVFEFQKNVDELNEYIIAQHQKE